MRLILATQGTLGDHLPMVGLAQKLMQSGFEVRLACNHAMHRFVQSAGVQPLPFGTPLAEVEACRNALGWDHWQFSLADFDWSEDTETRMAFDVSTLIDQLTPGDLLIGAKNVRFLSLIAQASKCRFVEVGLNPGSMIDDSRLDIVKYSTHFLFFHCFSVGKGAFLIILGA